MIALYYQTKTPISFLCRQGLNPRSLIQPSEILSVELTETHHVLIIIIILESFNLWLPLLMIVLFYQTKIPISFWCRWGLNPKSLIQPSKTLPVELTGTRYVYIALLFIIVKKFCHSKLMATFFYSRLTVVAVSF